MEPQLPQRRKMRLPERDYSQAGYYYITVCTKDKRCILGTVVGRDDLGAPQTETTAIGQIVEKYMLSIDTAYPFVKLDKHVIMPNHIHMILRIEYPTEGSPRAPHERRAGSSRPTKISHVVGCLKRFTNRDAGENLWQASYYDHIIRDETDYLHIWQYIDSNPAKWMEDEYFEA